MKTTAQTQQQYRAVIAEDQDYVYTVTANSFAEAREQIRQMACGPCHIKSIEKVEAK